MMKTYLVGGAVRDSMMNRKSKDNDFVVVGSTPEQMLSNGFTKVGADFPVFLHPETKDEYALARRERKTGTGYNGFEVVFDPSVTLIEDLARRDLTINAIAMDDDGVVVDPFNGQRDIYDRVLRPVSREAFAEDPVRALRVLRFLARFGNNWKMADELVELLVDMRDSGEFEHLVKERVLAEMMKAMSEPHWYLFFTTKIMGRPLFEEIIEQMVPVNFKVNMGHLDLSRAELIQVKRIKTNKHRFSCAVEMVHGFEDLLKFLKASTATHNQVKADMAIQCVHRVYWGDKVSPAEMAKIAVDKLELFDDQSPIFRFVQNHADNQLVSMMLKAREKAMMVKFHNAILPGDTNQEAAQRLHDFRLAVMCREIANATDNEV